MNSGHVSMPTQNIITITTNHTTLPHVQLLNCITLPLWGSHYSLWLICNDWLSSTTRAQTDPHIDYTQSKKENPAVQHKILIVIAPPPLPNITHSVIPVTYFSTPPQKKYAIDQPSVCMFLSVCVSRTDSSEPLFLHTSAALIGFVLGTHISAVLEIHQPWQVYCTTTLHRLWPTTRAKISLSIRETFMSRDEGGFEMTAATKRRHTKILASRKDHTQLKQQRQITIFSTLIRLNSVTHFCIIVSQK